MQRLQEIKQRLSKIAPYDEWITGGCSGRMITTPCGYMGDGFIADVDVKVNADFIANTPTDIKYLLDELEKTQDLLGQANNGIEQVSQEYEYLLKQSQAREQGLRDALEVMRMDKDISGYLCKVANKALARDQDVK